MGIRRKPRIYRKHHALRILLNVLIILLVTAIILSAVVFFWFRRYIVYTDDGLHLEIPWLADDTSDSAAETAAGARVFAPAGGLLPVCASIK